MPNWPSKVCKSMSILGASYASTMAIVWPVPSPLIVPSAKKIWLNPYAWAICAGVYTDNRLRSSSSSTINILRFRIDLEGDLFQRNETTLMVQYSFDGWTRNNENEPIFSDLLLIAEIDGVVNKSLAGTRT